MVGPTRKSLLSHVQRERKNKASNLGQCKVKPVKTQFVVLELYGHMFCWLFLFFGLKYAFNDRNKSRQSKCFVHFFNYISFYTITSIALSSQSPVRICGAASLKLTTFLTAFLLSSITDNVNSKTIPIFWWLLKAYSEDIEHFRNLNWKYQSRFL